MTTENTAGAHAALPELNDATITRLAAAWGVSPAEARAQYETAREAVAAQAEEDEARRDWERSERQAFSQWLENQPSPIQFSEHSMWLAWLGRACIAAEYEARVEDDIAERTRDTSAQIDLLTQQRDKARAEVERLSKLLNDQDLAFKVMAGSSAITFTTPWANRENLKADDQNAKVVTGPNANAELDFIHAFHDRVMVASEIVAERFRQLKKWGEQRHPLVETSRAWSIRPTVWVDQNYFIPRADSAKSLCEEAFAAGRGTFAHILVEEVAEAVDAPTTAEMRAELIQVAAVAMQMIEVIDLKKSEVLADG